MEKKYTIEELLNIDFTENNPIFKQIEAVFIYDGDLRIVHDNLMNSVFVNVLNYLIDLGLEVDKVKYIVTDNKPSHPQYFKTLKNGIKVKTWQGNCRAMKGIASAFRWLKDNKNLDLVDLQLKYFIMTQ